MEPVDSIAEHVECNESIQSRRVPTLPQSRRVPTLPQSCRGPTLPQCCRVPTLPLDSLGSNVLRYI